MSTREEPPSALRDNWPVALTAVAVTFVVIAQANRLADPLGGFHGFNEGF